MTSSFVRSRCCSADVLCSKLWRTVTGSEARRKVLDVLTSHYSALYYTHKHYAALNSGGVFSIQKNE